MLKRKRISVFGNPLVKKDSLPLKILPQLKKYFPQIEFVVEDPTETLTTSKDEWWIIDSAAGIDRVMLIDDFSKLDTFKYMTAHDYDLTLHLKLLKKIRKLNKFKIIAIPSDSSEKNSLQQVIKLLSL